MKHGAVSHPELTSTTTLGTKDRFIAVLYLPDQEAKRRSSIAHAARIPSASPPFGRPGFAVGIHEKVSRCAQAVPSGTNRRRKRAAMIVPANGESSLFDRSAPSARGSAPRLLIAPAVLHGFGRIWTNLDPVRRHHSALHRIVLVRAVARFRHDAC